MAIAPVLTPEQLDARWAELLIVYDAKGSAACQALIAREPDDVARNQLYRFAIRKLGGGTGAKAADLNAMIEIGDFAIANATTTAALHPAQALLWTDEANMSAFNISANLCDCWGDGDTRTVQHFKAGLRFADQALRFRKELGKGPAPFAMAHWARGKHLLSLRRSAEAAEALAASLKCEQEAATAKGAAAQPSELSPGGLLLANAFLELAKWRHDPAAGRAAYDTACGLLKAQAERGEGDVKDDAKAFLGQLQESERRN